MPVIKRLAKSVLPSRVWTRLRIARLRRSLKRFQARDVTHVYGGDSFRIHLSDPLAQGWYDHDWKELNEIALLKKHRLKPGARVFDLGAHQGVVALMLASAVGSEGLVVALEASPRDASIASQNRILNGFENIRIVNAAVAAKSGRLHFSDGLDGQVADDSGSIGTIAVDAFSIDDLARSYGVPDVLFIDVEGYECEALRGARETLAKQPDCFVEVHVGAGLEKFNGSVESLLGFFPIDHYDFFAASETAPEFVPFEPGADLAQQRFFLVAISR